MRLLEFAATILAVGALVFLPVVQADGNGVITISNPEELEAAIRDHSFLVVEFYAPWCGHCQQLQPEYAQAAFALRSDNIALAACDLTVDDNKILGEKYEIKGFPTLKMFRDGKMSDYNGPRKADGIVEYLRARAGPAYEEINTDVASHVDKLHQAGKIVVVAALSSAADITAFKEIAETLRDIAAVVITNKDGAKQVGAEKTPAVVVFPTGEEQEAVLYYGEIEADQVFAFVKDASLLTFGKICREEPGPMQAFIETKRAKLILLVSGENEEEIEQINAIPAALATGAHKKTFFVGWIHGTEFPQALSHFGVEASDLPAALVLVDAQDKKFKYSGAWDTAALVDFASKAISGGVKPYFKSSPAVDNSANLVKVVVRDNYEEYINGEKDVLLKVFAPWCGHCKQMAPAYEQLADALQDEKHVMIAELDGSTNDVPASLGAKGFPTIIWFSKGSTSPELYQGARTLQAMLAFVQEKSSSPLTKIRPVANSAIDSDTETFHQSEDTFTKLQAALGKTYYGGLSGYVYLSAAVLFAIAAIAMLVSALSSSTPSKPSSSKSSADAKGKTPEKKSSGKASKKDN